MISLLISILWIYSICGLSVLVFNKRFEIALPFSLIFGVFLLYFGGFIKHISYMYYFSYIFVIAFFVYLGYLIIKKKYDKLRIFKDNYLTIGSILFLIIIIYFNYLNIDRQLLFWDEYQHWGIMPSEMLRLDGFYCQTPSRLYLHKDYPPFFSLVELLWCYFNKGIYSEPNLFNALSIFSLALYMPLFKKFDKRNKKDWFKSLILIVVVVLVNCTISIDRINENIYFYNSIIIDWQMALLAAYCLYLAFNIKFNDTFDLINLSISMMALVLTKQMGTPLCMLVMLFLFIKIIIQRKELNKKILIKISILLLIFPILAYFSWAFIKHVYSVDIYSQFKISDISLNTLLNIINGTGGTSKEIISFNNFINKIFTDYLCRYPFKISYFPFAILLTVLLFVTIYVYRKDIKKSLSISIVYLFGSIAYAFTMLLTYVFMFDAEEGPALSSFDRYMFTYIFIGLVLLVMIFIEESKKDFISMAIVTLFVLAFVNKEDLYNLNLNKEYKKDISTDYTLIKEYNKKHFKNGDSILVIDQWKELDERNNNNNVLKYTYIINNNQVDTISFDDNNISLQDYIKLLSNYDYIYTNAVNDCYINNYWQKTTKDWLLNERLYRIEIIDNNTVKYHLIEE